MGVSLASVLMNSRPMRTLSQRPVGTERRERKLPVLCPAS